VYNRLIFLGFIITLISCNSDEGQFTLLHSDSTGITFNNIIDDQGDLNILNFEYIYNGGGVAIGDLNNDDLQDIVFTGNMENNAVYLNKGNFKFEDISVQSGIQSESRWSTGITLVDINGDDKLDIYICSSGHKRTENKTNLLYVNQGNDIQGIPVFKEMAEAYGIADASNSTMAAFFDYDNDQDLDLIVVANVMPDNRAPSRYRKKVVDGSSDTDDHLYRNEWDEEKGHPVFTEVSHEAGILIEGFSLGLNICDLNRDGWKDIYITNDYLSNDLLYINNQDGTFTNKADTYFKHTSFSAMGNDVIDLDNDGLSEIVALDMLPEDNFRKKTMLPPNSYNDHVNNEKYNFQYQFVRNTLQKNSGGNQPSGESPIFSDVALMSGIAATDWSWTPLIADFDNDSDRDIIITNGFPKDVTDRDFIDYSNEVKRLASPRLMLKKAPSVKLKNYAYKNNGNLQFENVGDDWGIMNESFSNGAAYGDLDNDGDLDYVVNNINDEAFVFENKSFDTNWIRIKLKGSEKNLMGLGSLIHIYHDSTYQSVDFTTVRGYRSSQEPITHFGLNDHTLIDSIIVIWPDQRVSKLENVTSNNVIEIEYVDSAPAQPDMYVESTMVTDISTDIGLDLVHDEIDYIDFFTQPLLIHKLSQYGPGLSVGDANGDGLDDLFISGSHNFKGNIMLQNEDGSFSDSDYLNYGDGRDTISEELGALFFDADQDGDNDLYVTHGGYEFDINDSQYVDALYVNKNKKLIKSDKALPETLSSTQSVRATDFDADGDLDLFVGARVAPYNYPKAVSGQILRNDSKGNTISFVDVTKEIAPTLIDIGMITDALWTDFNNDNQIDLIIVGEFMSITFLENNQGKFTDVTSSSGISDHLGWWNSLTAGDYDNDGDTDYIVGNYGENFITQVSSDHPLKAYYKDFDNNGTADLVTTCFFPSPEGIQKEYSYFGSTDVAKQYNAIKKKFVFHKDFANSSIEEILSPEELNGAYVLEANDFKTSYVENLGAGKFALSALPSDVQVAPINGMLTRDVNNDGQLDVLMIGNDYGSEVKLGRLDAHNGLIGLGDGEGGFRFQEAHSSGFLVQEDAKALVSIHNKGLNKTIFIASQNRGDLRSFAGAEKERILTINSKDTHAIITYKNGKVRKEEFYYGNGFISQSSRTLTWHDSMEKVEVYARDEMTQIMQSEDDEQ
jgi:hypothetical protein